MNVKDNRLYKEDIESVLKLKCDFSKLKGKSFLITGATGLIGSCLVDMLVLLSESFGLNLTLYLVSRQKGNFTEDKGGTLIQYIKCDFSTEKLREKLPETYHIDFIFHLASTTHPLAYSKQPIETIMINVNGTHELLELCSLNNPCRFILASSVEVYGDDRKRLLEGFAENDFGYLDCNTSRSCYSEAKRLCESLCHAYKAEKNCDIVIARIARSFGATLRKDDTKVLSQFLQKGINRENVVLKSGGRQYFSYIYAPDAAAGLVFCMFSGKNGEAYNIADKNSNIHLKDLARIVAERCGVEVVYDAPEQKEKEGYSKSVYAVLNPDKLNSLGWKAHVGLEEGIRRTIEIMRGAQG